MKFIAALLFVLPLCAMASTLQPEPYCRRLPFDDEKPPGLIGEYQLIGKNGGTKKTYSGSLQIASTKSHYSLIRLTKGSVAKGEAWMESCGPDKFELLAVRYSVRGKPIEFHCYLRFDGDNYTRASCSSFDGKSLEAWYQNH